MVQSRGRRCRGFFYAPCPLSASHDALLRHEWQYGR